MPTSILGPLFPNEPVWGGLTRFAARHRHLTDSAIVASIGPTKWRHVFFAFPLELPRWVEAFSWEGCLDDFLIEHTAWPYFSPLAVTREYLREQITAVDAPCYNGFSWYHKFVRFTDDTAPSSLRACPECAVSDRQAFGLSYFHIDHQIAGLNICCKHRVPLWETDANYPGPAAWHFMAMEDCKLIRPPRTRRSTAFQKFVADQIGKLPIFKRGVCAPGKIVQRALWHEGFPVGCKESGKALEYALWRRFGSEYFTLVEDLTAWEVAFFGPYLSPINFLLVCYLLDRDPKSMAGDPNSARYRGTVTQSCIANNSALQRKRERRLAERTGWTFCQKDNRWLCSHCKYRFSKTSGGKQRPKGRYSEIEPSVDRD